MRFKQLNLCPEETTMQRFVDDQTRDRRLDFRRMQVASDQITLLVESSDDITQDSEVFVPVRIILDSVSLTR